MLQTLSLPKAGSLCRTGGSACPSLFRPPRPKEENQNLPGTGGAQGAVRLPHAGSLPGGKDTSGQRPPANTHANTTGHSRLPSATFRAQTWTACSSDYRKLSMFDKMIPFVLAESAFILFFAFILNIPFRVQPAFLRPRSVQTSCSRTQGRPGEGSFPLRRRTGRWRGRLGPATVWLQSSPRGTAPPRWPRWQTGGRAAGDLSQGRGENRSQAEGAVGKKVHLLRGLRKPRLGRAPPSS